MEENRNDDYRHEDYERKYEDYNHKNHWLRDLLTWLLTLLGAFLAFYAVSDWHFKRVLDPAYQIRRMDKQLMRDERDFNNMERKELKRQAKIDKRASSFVHVDKTNDAYKIIIDLKPFDNDERNIEVTTSGNSLTINAAGERNSNKRQEFIRYNQTYSFGNDVNMSLMTKERHGDEYIITVPFN